jgi:hypothetical protein
VRWPRKARPGEVNHPPVDRFTLAHAAIGAAYALLGLGLLPVVALALAWELVENPLKAWLPKLFPHATADTLPNSIGDTAAVLLGWTLARTLLG